MNQPDPTQTAVDRIPLSHSVRYVARGLPDVPNQYGQGVLRPSEITLTYRASPDSQLGRVHAYVAGRLWVDGREIPLLPSGGLYGQYHDDGLPDWPEWLTEEARLHDPEVPAALTEAERTMLAYALDQAQEHIWSRDGFTAEDQAAVDSLRRLAAVPAAEEQPDNETPELAALFEGFARLLATSSRDWGVYRVDAWLYAVILGWDCEEAVHDETCTHGAMEEMQQLHGWDDEAVAKARRYRAVVRALTAPPAVVPQPEEAHAPTLHGAAELEEKLDIQKTPCDYERTTGHVITCGAGFGMGCDCDDDAVQPGKEA